MATFHCDPPGKPELRLRFADEQAAELWGRGLRELCPHARVRGFVVPDIDGSGAGPWQGPDSPLAAAPAGAPRAAPKRSLSFEAVRSGVRCWLALAAAPNYSR